MNCLFLRAIDLWATHRYETIIREFFCADSRDSRDRCGPNHRRKTKTNSATMRSIWTQEIRSEGKKAKAIKWCNARSSLEINIGFGKQAKNILNQSLIWEVRTRNRALPSSEAIAVYGKTQKNSLRIRLKGIRYKIKNFQIFIILIIGIKIIINRGIE